MKDLIYFYPVWDKPNYHHNALKYSLRSLVYQGLPNVAIAGAKPNWINWDKVTYIDQGDPDSNPYYNVVQKILKAFEVLNVDKLVLMNDDLIFLESYNVKQPMPCRYRISLQYRTHQTPPVSPWSKNWARTKKLFPYGTDYDTHYPMLIERDKWGKMCEKYDMYDYHYKTLYGNEYNLPYTPVYDCKTRLSHGFKFGDWQKAIISTHDTQENTKAYRDFMNLRFSKKSIYER